MSVLLLLALSAHAGPDPAELIPAIEAELDRSLSSLTLQEAPDLYHLRYHVVLLSQASALASFGGLIRAHDRPHQALGVEVRVGRPEFDNTGFGGWQNGFGMAWLPMQVTPEALRIEAWRLTDRAYKQAVEHHARKSAQFVPPEDYPGDYLLTGPVVADDGRAEVADPAALTELAQRLSAVFLDTPRLDRGEVHVGHDAGVHLVVDSEGTRVIRPLEEVSIRALVHVRTDDGMLLTDQRLWTVRRDDQLPAYEKMEAEVRQMAATLLAQAEGAPMAQEYVGPVIFEGQAALDLFRYLLLPQLEGTPSDVPFEAWFGELGQRRSPVQPGRRVLPQGWSVSDDPTRDPDSPASYRHDMEGTPATRVALVTDGAVQSALMSRVPRSDLAESTGHARGSLGARLAGRAAMTRVEPRRAVSPRRLQSRAARLAQSYGLDHVLVVRRLEEPAIRQMGTSAFLSGSDGPRLPPPIEVVRRYPDGREEPVRGLSFASVHRWILRDIALAGAQTEGVFLASSRGGDPAHLGPVEGMPTWLSVPQVLVHEMELVPAPGDSRQVPVLPPPTAQAE